MWYSYAVVPPTSLDPSNDPQLNPCAPLTLGRIEIGYATSQDGYFWTRSPLRRANESPDSPVGRATRP